MENFLLNGKTGDLNNLKSSISFRSVYVNAEDFQIFATWCLSHTIASVILNIRKYRLEADSN